MSDDCLFCKIAAGDIPSEEVYSDNEFYAFKDINPAEPVHVLVIPRTHIPMIIDARQEDKTLLGNLFLTANKVVQQLGLDIRGFRYIVNCGKDGGQSVFHIHLHILGGRAMGWPPGND